MPSNVYWTRRTVEQVAQGFLPLPNFHLLSKEYHYLYPNLFSNCAKNVSQISQVPTFTNKSYVRTKELLKVRISLNFLSIRLIHMFSAVKFNL